MMNIEGIVSTSMAGDSLSIDVTNKKDCKICTCSSEGSMNSLLISDETSIYEYDYDCLSQKQKEL